MPLAAANPPTPVRATWLLDVSDAVPLAGRFEIAASWIAPPELAAGSAVPLLVCLPGGFLSRHYFDLGTDGDRRYSFAEAMVARGYAVLAFDHLGVGDSTKPVPEEAGLTLGVDAIAAANQRALERARARIEAGDPASGTPPLEISASVGVGHSMGSMLTVEQQALALPHLALLLFSFSTAGTPRFLDETLMAYADDPERLRREMPRVATAAMGGPYPPRANGPADDRRAAFGVGTAGDAAERALEDAATNLLAVGGLTSMIPGGYAPAAEKVEAPVLMVFGDHDLHDDRRTAAELPLVRDLSTYCLPDAWHCHFVANTRATLWDVVDRWLAARLADEASPHDTGNGPD